MKKKKKTICECAHYGVSHEYIDGTYLLEKEEVGFSLLEAISETQCQCTRCGKVFPIAQYQKMESKVSHNIGELTEGLEPGKYKRKCNTVITMLDPENEEQILGTYAQKEKMRLCKHYFIWMRDNGDGHCRSLLKPINEKECQCTVCGKVFSMEQYQQMEELTQSLIYKMFILGDDDDFFWTFSQCKRYWKCDVSWTDEVAKIVKPVRYRKINTKKERID